MLDPHKIRSDFPILKRKYKGNNLCYLDNAATTQKPKLVINAIKNYYEKSNANVHRGIHFLSEEATSAYEKCREKIVKFINAKNFKEIIFTKNCTEAINLIGYTWGKFNIKKGDEIIVSALEHHSNLVIWQELAKLNKASLKIIPLNSDFSINYNAYSSLLTSKTKLVAISMMSNVLGTIIDVKKIINEARKIGATVLVDAAQAAGHIKIDVQKLNCDFLAFSGHKMLGPTGVGVLYGKEKILEAMPPFLMGGDMVHNVEQTVATFNELPWRFEAGTPNIADIIAFEKAIEYLEKFKFDDILDHGIDLADYAYKLFSKYKEVSLYYPKNKKERSGILSFAIKGVHPHDIASIFNEKAVAIRSGHHCCQPLLEKWLKIPATARMSFYIYNTKEEVEKAEEALKDVLKIFK